MLETAKTDTSERVKFNFFALVLIALVSLGFSLNHASAQILNYNPTDGSWSVEVGSSGSYVQSSDGFDFAAQWGDIDIFEDFPIGNATATATINGTPSIFVTIVISDDDNNGIGHSVTIGADAVGASPITSITDFSTNSNLPTGLSFDSSSIAAEDPSGNNNLAINLVPEPASGALLLGAVSLLALRRRRA